MKAKLITFVRGLSNGTPPRFQSYLKSLILLGFLTIGISQAQAKEGDILAEVSGTGSGYGRQTTTDSHNVGWVTIGQSGYFGINSAANNTGAKAGVNATDLPVAKAVNASATSSTSTSNNSCTGYYTFYTTTALKNVGSIEFYYSANSGNSNATAYVVMGDAKSASGGAAYAQVPLAESSTSKQGVSLGTSGKFTFTFAETQTSAKYYGVVIATSSYKRMTGGKITIKEGASSSKTALAQVSDLSAGTPSATSATITWTGISDSELDGYKVEYKKNSESTWTVAIAKTTETTCTLSSLTPSTTYNYRVTSLAKSTSSTKKDSDPKAGTNFTTDAPASREIKWYANNQQVYAKTQQEGAALTIPSDPDATTYCYGKTFVGWTASQNYSDASTAPGDLFTSTDSKTVGSTTAYYAVFADASAGAATPKTLSFTYNSHSDWTITTCKDNSSYYIMNTGGSIVSPTFDVSNITQITANCRTYGGASYDKINVKCEGTTLGTITAAGNSLADANISFASPKPSLSGTKSLTFSPATATNANGPGVASITISYTGSSITYSNYTTSCAPPSQCQTPVISLAGGTYTEAKTTTITCGTDGATIYYTTNGNTPSASSTPYTGAITVNQDMTIKAIAIKAGLENSEIATASYTINYTVTFDMMGHGSAIAALTSVKYNASINSSKPTDPSVLGYDFGGWYKENTCTNAWNWITDKVTGNITLYANWTAKQCDLIFDKNDAEAEGSMAQQSFTFNETKALTTNAFTRAHKNFTGWATTAGGSKTYDDGANYKMTTEGATLYAVWAWNKTEITLDKQGGNGGNSKVTATYNSEMPYAGAVPTKTGYDFNGYYTGQNGTGTQYYSSTNASVQNWDKDDASLTLYAYWTPKTITITLDANGHGEANGSFTIVYGTKVATAFTAVTPKTGYTLRGYFTGAAGTGAIVVNTDGTLGGELNNWIDEDGNWNRSSDGTLYACYTPDKHTVSWVVSGNSWTGKGGSTKADYDSRVANVPTPPTTSNCDFMKVFVGWTATEIVGTTNIRPSDLFTDAANAPIIKGDATYHAVFATVDESATEYAKGTLDDLQTGKRVLLVHNKYSNNYAVSSIPSTENYLDAVSVSVVNSKITTSNASIIWNVTKNNTQYKFDQGSNKKLNVNTTGLYANTTDGSFVITGSSPYELKAASETVYIDYWGSDGFTKFSSNHSDNYIDFYLPATTYSEYATTCVECTNRITISKGEEVEHGSYSLSKTGDVCLSNIQGGTYSVTVTATPDEHYHLATVTTSSSGTAGEVVDNTCVVTGITANTTLTAVFEEDPKVTVTWHKGTSTETTANVYVGTLYSGIAEFAPTVADDAAGDCADKFMGWATASISDISGVDESDVEWVTDDYEINNTHKDIYAVFAKGSDGGTGSVVLSYTSLGLVTTGYESGSTKTVSDIDFYLDGIMTGTSGQPGYQKIQFRRSKNGSGYIYNSEAMPGNITSIVLSSTTKNMTVYFGTSANPNSNEKTCTSSSLTATPSGNYTYFKIVNAEDGAAYIETITINYSSVSYSNYVTSCEAQEYSVTYKDQGDADYSGSNAGSLVDSYTSGTGATLVDGTKDGHIFGGWYTNSECTGDRVTSISASESGNKTFYAKWTANWKLMGSWDSYQQNDLTEVSAHSFTFTKELAGNTTYWIRCSDGGSHVYALAGPSTMDKDNCTNWDFYKDDNTDCGLQTTAAGEYTFTISDTHSNNDDSYGYRLQVSVTYPASVAVTMNLNGQGSNYSLYTVPGGTISAPANPSADDYAFLGWFTDQACSPGHKWDFSNTISEDMTLYAKWTKSWYYLGEWDDNWDPKLMEMAQDGIYWYWYTYASTEDRQFKIKHDDWVHGRECNQPGFNCTDITNMNDYYNTWDKIDMRCAVNYNSGRYYIIVYPPYTDANPSNEPIICASTTLPDATKGFTIPSGVTVYFDNYSRQWSNLHLRMGRSCHNLAWAMTKVPGTANLWKFTTDGSHNYSNYWAIHVANNCGWTDKNSIYKTKTGDTHAITNATSFMESSVGSDITIIPGSDHSTGTSGDNNNCEFYSYTKQRGMLTHNAAITAPTNGTITVTYTDVNNSGQNFTSGNRDLAHSCILTISAAGATGYDLASLTVNGTPFTSGSTLDLTEDITIAATFSLRHHTLTVNVAGGIGGTAEAVTTSVGEGETTTITATPAEHYSFTSWAVTGTGASLSSTTANPTTFTMGTTDATVTATFTRRTFTVITNDNGIEKSDEVNEGESYTLPALSCESEDFEKVGWTKTAPTDNRWASKPTLAGATVSEGGTYYAVYGEGGGEAPTNDYKLITGSEFESGANYVIAAIVDATHIYAMSANNYSSSYHKFERVKVSPDANNVIKDVDAKLVWKLTNNSIYSAQENKYVGVYYEEEESDYVASFTSSKFTDFSIDFEDPLLDNVEIEYYDGYLFYFGLFDDRFEVLYSKSNTTVLYKQQIGEGMSYISNPVCCVDKVEAPMVDGATKTHESITLSWSNVDGATGYKVTINGGTQDVTTSSCSHTESGLTPNTAYSWTVVATWNPEGDYCGATPAIGSTTTNPLYTLTITDTEGVYDIKANKSTKKTQSFAAGTEITLSGTTRNGYIFGEWVVMQGETPITVTDNKFTMPTANVTVTATFTAKKDYYVDDMNDNEQIVMEGQYTVPGLPDVVTPSSNSCEQTHLYFVGWIEGEIGSGQEEEPTGLIRAGAAGTAKEKTYHAVWAEDANSNQ